MRATRWLTSSVSARIATGAVALIAGLALATGGVAAAVGQDPVPIAPGEPAPDGSDRPDGSPTEVPAAGTSLHYATGVSKASRAASKKVGFNLVQTSTKLSEIKKLGAGQQALVWVGGRGGDGCDFDVSTQNFKSTVDKIARDKKLSSKVFGFYLYERPSFEACSELGTELTARASYIHEKSPAHKSFVLHYFNTDITQLGPDKSNIDLIGLDVEPCWNGSCRFGAIDDAVQQAGTAGIRPESIVPVYQARGKDCGVSGNPPPDDDGLARPAVVIPTLPNAADTQTILERWRSLIPNPVFDVTRSWGLEKDECVSLATADGTQRPRDTGDGAVLPDLHSVYRAWFQASAESGPTPDPTPTSQPTPMPTARPTATPKPTVTPKPTAPTPRPSDELSRCQAMIPECGYPLPT